MPSSGSSRAKRSQRPHTRRQVTHRHVQRPNRRHARRFEPSCAASRLCARVMGGIAWSGVSRPAHCLAASVQRVHCWRLASNRRRTHSFDWTRLEQIKPLRVNTFHQRSWAKHHRAPEFDARCTGSCTERSNHVIPIRMEALTFAVSSFPRKDTAPSWSCHVPLRDSHGYLGAEAGHQQIASNTFKQQVCLRGETSRKLQQHTFASLRGQRLLL